MNDDQLVEAYTGGGAGLPGLRAVELAATASLTARLQAAQATIAEALAIPNGQTYIQEVGHRGQIRQILSRADTSAFDAAILAAKAEALREAANHMLDASDGEYLHVRAASIEQTEGE